MLVLPQISILPNEIQRSVWKLIFKIQEQIGI